jgi:hypothetical protein
MALNSEATAIYLSFRSDNKTFLLADVCVLAFANVIQTSRLISRKYGSIRVSIGVNLTIVVIKPDATILMWNINDCSATDLLTY